MTRLWVLSDLHQEHADNAWDPAREAPPAFDAVVVAGDVDTPGTSALRRLAAWFPNVPVLYVPGNHDFYRCETPPYATLWEMRTRMAEEAARLGLWLLDDGEATVAGLRFVGGTLWTDMRLGAPNRSAAHSAARRGMNDYRRIRRRPSGHHCQLRTEETVDLHRRTVAWLEGTQGNARHADVVVTHHAPSRLSLQAAPHDLDHCYASDLSEAVARWRVPLWVHGHTHLHRDYRLGGTRVVANPRGHRGEPTGYVPGMVVEASPRALVDFAEGRLGRAAAVEALVLRDYADLLNALGDHGLYPPRPPPEQAEAEAALVERFIRGGEG